MNAAARLVHQGVLSRHLVLSYLFARRQLGVWLLVFSVLLSALSLIYVTNATRELYARYQANLAEQHQLHIDRSKLLLERGAYVMEARIQQVAEKQLGMLIPGHKSVVIVRE